MNTRLASILASLFAAAALRAAAPTTVTITDKVLVPDTLRLGIHFSGDNYYDSPILKERVHANFEGSIQRLHVGGPDKQPASDGSLLSFVRYDESLNRVWAGATYLVLAGPDKGKTGKVVSVSAGAEGGANSKSKSATGKSSAPAIWHLDQPIRWGPEMNGILVENSDLTIGRHPWLGKPSPQSKTGQPEVDARYCTPERNLLVSDVRPGGFGHTALQLAGAEKPAFIQFRTQFYNAYPYDGAWTVKFWARSPNGARLTVGLAKGPANSQVEVKPSTEWAEYERTVVFPRPSDDKGLAMLEFRATGGDVVVDDIVAWKQEKSGNPTAFRDELVDVLRELRPGVMRYLRNDKDSMLNSISPALYNVSMGPTEHRSDFGAHEFYTLCEYLDCGAWATLPGTMRPEEILPFMEYLGAPADVGLGKLRAAWGHPEPWTKTLKHIYVQFGNEVITFGGTGFQGPDYWKGMIEQAKASPYYRPNVVFVVNEQGGASQILNRTPNADSLCVNTYQLMGLYQKQIQRAGDRAGFYDFVFAANWHMLFSPDNNKNITGIKAAQAAGKEVSVYEGGNYHTTFSEPDNSPVDQINRMITGKAGGLNATHNMLGLLKAYGARVQNSFNLSQFSFSPGGSFGNLPKPARLWGGVLSPGDPAALRYRPRLLALAVANRAIAGDLVETVHTGDVAKFTVTNFFGAGYGPSRDPKEITVADVPRVCSYAFRNGKRHGLILVSQDTRETRPVEIRFPGEVEGEVATTWLLDGPDLESNNEPDFAPDAPQVKISESHLSGFKSGARVDIPPASMLSITWTER